VSGGRTGPPGPIARIGNPITGTSVEVATQLAPWLAGCIAPHDVSRGANLETRPAAVRDGTSISGASRATTTCGSANDQPRDERAFLTAR